MMRRVVRICLLGLVLVLTVQVQPWPNTQDRITQT